MEKMKSMYVQHTTLTEISHKVLINVMSRLEKLEERIFNLEILLTSKDENEKEQIRIALESNEQAFKDKISAGVVK